MWELGLSCAGDGMGDVSSAGVGALRALIATA